MSNEVAGLTTVEFHFDYRSPYSYLAQTQLPSLGATISHHPFDLRELMKRVDNVPTSVLCPPKNRYLRGDLVRWATRYGVPFERHPDLMTIDGRRLLRATLAAEHVGDIGVATSAIFQALWGKPAPLSTAADLANLLSAAGLDVSRLHAMIDADETDAEVETATARAVERGVFGAPTFFVRDEMFFGNDRLDWVRERVEAKA